MQLFHILLSAIAALFQRICPQVCHHLTKSSKSPASIAKNNKQWVGDLLVSGGVQEQLFGVELRSEADCEYPLDLNQVRPHPLLISFRNRIRRLT